MAEIAERMVKIIADAAYAEARGVCPMNIEALTAGIDRLVADACAESEAARLKAEGERDEARLERAELERLDRYESKCACLVDGPEAVCLAHGPAVARVEARLRAVIEAADRLADGLDDSNNNHSAGCACDYHDALATYRRVRDAQASPEPEASPRPEVFQQQVRTLREIGASERVVEVAEQAAAEASKQAGHEFNSTARPWVKFADEPDTCRICGLPWSQHGGLLREEGRRG